MPVDIQLQSHAGEGILGVEGPQVSILVVEVPWPRVVEGPWVEAARAREDRAGAVVVVVHGDIAHRAQARWTSNSPEHFVKLVAAAAAGAHDPVADY